MRAAAFPSFRKFYRRVDHWASSAAAAGTNAAAAAATGAAAAAGAPSLDRGDDDANDAKGSNSFARELFASGLPTGNYTLTIGYGMFAFLLWLVFVN